MNFNFDPTQETHEEYLRRMHLEDKLKAEWNYGQEENKESQIKKTEKRTDIS